MFLRSAKNFFFHFQVPFLLYRILKLFICFFERLKNKNFLLLLNDMFSISAYWLLALLKPHYIDVFKIKKLFVKLKVLI